MNDKPVVALVRDLFFGARLHDAVGALGYGFERVDTPAALLSELEATRPRLVIVDLALGTGHLAEVASRAGEARLLAFGPHVDTAKRQAALDAGFHEWVSNGRLTRELPALLDRHLRSPGESDDRTD